MMSRADILKEVRQFIKESSLKAPSQLKKHELMRCLATIRKFNELYKAEPEQQRVKPGPLGTRESPVQPVEVDGAVIAAPAVPRKRKTEDRSKPRRYVADMVENHGLVSFKD